MASVHDKLERVRKPRVHITYQVETEGAVVQKELPFVVGVLGDFSGNPTTPQKALKDKKFVQIDRDNFNDIMLHIKPELNINVENTLLGDGSQLPVSLSFQSITDFEPASIVSQIPPLRQLLQARNQLRDLLTKADRSEELENILEMILKNKDDLAKLSTELGIEAPQATESTSN